MGDVVKFPGGEKLNSKELIEYINPEFNPDNIRALVACVSDIFQSMSAEQINLLKDRETNNEFKNIISLASTEIYDIVNHTNEDDWVPEFAFFVALLEDLKLKGQIKNVSI